MWIIPNHDSQLEKKDAKNILKGKVFRHSKPMTSRSMAHYLSKRGKFLSSKQPLIICGINLLFFWPGP